MKVAVLPLEPLIQTFLASTPRLETVRLEQRLSESFFDTATDTDFEALIFSIYEGNIVPPLHQETLRKKIRWIRHGVNHLLRCSDPFILKLDRCLDPKGAYFVPGIGLRFWSVFFHQIDPEKYPIWDETSEVGLQRLGLLTKTSQSKAKRYAKLLLACDRFRSLHARLAPSEACRFLTLVARMRGRELFPLENETIHSSWFRSPIDALPDLLRQMRIRSPLRKRLKEHQSQIHLFRKQFDEALRSEDRTRANELLLHQGIASIPQSLFDWTLQLWQSDQPEELLNTFWGCEDANEVGLSFPVRLLHLRDPKRFPIWDEGSRRGLALLDEGFDPSLPPNIGYSLYQEATQVLCERYRVHSLEMMDLLHLVSQREGNLRYERIEEQSQFHGFCSDTFAFLNDLAANNQTTWMNQQRERYQFVLREPLLELCHRLTERYVEPVLRKGFGWDLETEPRTGKAISSIVKNDYGQTVPYQPWMWLTFYRQNQNKQQEVQFFVRVESTGLEYGFHLGKKARESGSRFRKNIQEHGELIYRNLLSNQALKECQFFNDQGQLFTIKNAADLRTWATEKSLFAGRRLVPDSSLLRQDDLVGEIVLTFDRLLPLFVCCLEEDTRAYLQKRVGSLEGEMAFDCSTFQSQTYLPKSWLDRALQLLELKKQLILQGVPGTGKTHVAKNLARFLTGDKSENIRLVQFHPAFSYEEFVEGIKARTVEINGRNEITYPIEEGVLCEFASQAMRQPSKPFVLLIDEINRGNLPRIFGELLYLLEYRDQAVSLPYSRRSFRLPQNLYLIGTMNRADRSVAAIDQALRRRFSFLDMTPDAGVLSSWFEKHPLPEGEGFGQQVVTLFETLNEQLQQDLGPNYQIGHSYFMVPNLNESRLRMVWQHHIQPLLQEYFIGQLQRLSNYDLNLLLQGKDNRKRKKIEY